MSQYFECAFFQGSTSVADEHYERTRDRIFEKDPTKSKIEVRCQIELTDRSSEHTNTACVAHDVDHNSSAEPNEEAWSRQSLMDIPYEMSEEMRKHTISLITSRTCSASQPPAPLVACQGRPQYSQSNLTWAIVYLDTTKVRDFVKVFTETA